MFTDDDLKKLREQLEIAKKETPAQSRRVLQRIGVLNAKGHISGYLKKPYVYGPRSHHRST